MIKFSKKSFPSSGLYMKDSSPNKYHQTEKGKASQARAQEKYDKNNPEKRRAQKRDYMRRKRAENPGYCKWK